MVNGRLSFVSRHWVSATLACPEQRRRAIRNSPSVNSFTAKDTKDAKEQNSFTAKGAKDSKEQNSSTAKDTKDAKLKYIENKGREDNAK